MIINSQNYLRFTDLYNSYKDSIDNESDGRELILTVKNQVSSFNSLSSLFEVTLIGNDQISILLFSDSLKIFLDKKVFLKDFSNGDTQKDIGILNYSDDSYLFFNYQKQKYYEIDSSGKSVSFERNQFIENTIFYQKIFDLIKEKLAIYNASSNRELVLTSSAGKEQPFLIGYPSVKQELSDLNLQAIFESLKEELNRKDFTPFFKHQICLMVSDIHKRDRYIEFLKRYYSILESANLDFEIYLRDFSFDKIRTKFRESRDKYFQSIQEIDSKLYAKSASLVISVSASIFATFKFGNDTNWFGGLVVLLVYTLYSLYSCFEVVYAKEDLGIIWKNFEKEINEVREQSLRIAQTLEEDINQVKVKFINTNKRMPIIYSFLSLMNLLVFSFIFLQNYQKYYFIFIVFLLIFLLSHYMIWINACNESILKK